MAIEALQARRTPGITVKATGPLMMKMKSVDGPRRVMACECATKTEFRQ